MEGSPSHAVPLPEQWQPSTATVTWALNGSMGVTQTQLDEQLDAFRDHARAYARKQANWDSAFKNWIRKAKQFGSIGSGSGAYAAKGVVRL
jgi:hypothetical protein